MLTGKIKGNSTHTGTESATESAEADGKEKEGSETSSETLRKRISELMSVRSAIYEKTAHLIIDIDGLDFRQAAEKAALSLPYCC